jgi:hypothetical protein
VGNLAKGYAIGCVALSVGIKLDGKCSAVRAAHSPKRLIERGARRACSAVDRLCYGAMCRNAQRDQPLGLRHRKQEVIHSIAGEGWRTRSDAGEANPNRFHVLASLQRTLTRDSRGRGVTVTKYSNVKVTAMLGKLKTFFVGCEEERRFLRLKKEVETTDQWIADTKAMFKGDR